VARILGVKVWELDTIPIRYREEAIMIHNAKREALAEAVQKGVMQVVILEL
jgi:hypothetical protein